MTIPGNPPCSVGNTSPHSWWINPSSGGYNPRKIRMETLQLGKVIHPGGTLKSFILGPGPGLIENIWQFQL